MTQLEWDKIGDRRYKNGVSKGVLFIPNNQGLYPAGSGHAWSGLTAITKSPSGAEATKIYADNIVYANLVGAEEFNGTIEALYYPDAWAACDGTAMPEPGVYVGQQARSSFGLVWRTEIGSDLTSELGYELNLAYGALAAPSEKASNTINDTPEAATFSWEFSTTPVAVGGGLRPTSILTIDSTQVDATALEALEDILFGTAGVNARLPLPAEVISMFSGTVTEVTATAPTATSAGVITIPTVTGVEYRRADTNEVVTGTVTIVGIGNSLLIRANAVSGSYRLDPDTDDDWSFTKTT